MILLSQGDLSDSLVGFFPFDDFQSSEGWGVIPPRLRLLKAVEALYYSGNS